ncbi:hypothetical protein M8J77_011619 [Diaphorina citri]|nr:hypothetical protein M8J77_011619 [Diaphorina citri]
MLTTSSVTLTDQRHPPTLGCAYSVGNMVRSTLLNPVNSIFSAELIAIFLCLEAILDSPSDQFLMERGSAPPRQVKKV